MTITKCVTESSGLFLFMANIGADDGSQKLIVLKIMIIINSQNLGFVKNISGQLNLEMF